MKSILKLALAATVLFLISGTNHASAQKFGYIDFQELVLSMPDIQGVEANLETLQKELSSELETMEVSFNKKLDDYQKTSGTLTESIRQMKEQELQGLQQRMQQFAQQAQADLRKKEGDLLAPVAEKARAAVNTVLKANGFTAVFEKVSIVSYDESLITDLMPLVKTHLGL